MKILITFFILLISQTAFSAGKDYSLFFGAGPGWSLPGPIRLRFHNVEVGTYGIALGVTKSFRQEHVYAQFGAGLSPLGKSDLGIIGAIGTEYLLLGPLGVRGEFFSFFGGSGFAYNGATLGLSISF